MESDIIKFCILIPSRNRSNELLKTLNNIIDKTYNLDNIEILLGIDDDDANSIHFELPENILKKVKVKKIILKRKFGYQDQPWRLKEMVNQSNSDFFLHFADDMKIISDQWDKILENEIKNLPQDKIYLMYPKHNQKNENWPLCQIISKNWFLTAGKFSNFFEIDTELMIIAGVLKRIYQVKKMEIFHEHNDNKIKDATFIEGREKTLKYKFNKKSILSISSLFLVFMDCEILKNKINNKYNNKFVNLFKVILLFFPRIYWINKIYKLNYLKIFIKNIIYLKI